VQAHIQLHGSGNLKNITNFGLPSYLCANLKKKNTYWHRCIHFFRHVHRIAESDY